MVIKIPRGWEIPEREATPEEIFTNRRQFIKKLGLAPIFLWAALKEGRGVAAAMVDHRSDNDKIYPAKRNAKYALDRPLTGEWATAHYNNFYEFTTDKQPPTFWNDVAPNEYDFFSNVNPKVPHPRWSQATKQPIPGGPRRPRRLYNGYAEDVAQLYKV